MKSGYLLLLLFLCTITHVSAIIDGRTAPVIREASYTFTNFEWARGLVQFKKGFTLTSTNTVFLDVNYPIEGAINLNNTGSTIILEGNLYLGSSCSINGTCHIKTNGYEIFISKSALAITRPIYFFDDDVIINGTNTTRIQIGNFSGAFNFKRVANVTFKNIDLFVVGPSSSLIFPTSNLTTLNLYNADLSIFGSSPLTLGAQDVIIGGDSSFSGRGTTITIPQSLTLLPLVNFKVEEFVTLAVNSLNMGSTESIFTLQNLSSIQFTNTLTTTLTGDGRFFIKGQASFKGNGNTLIISNTQDTIMDVGSRLSLENIYVKIT